MEPTEEEILAFVRRSINSVWSLELLLLLRRQPERAWRPDDFVRELRSSQLAVAAAAAALQGAGLLSHLPGGSYQYWPSSPELARNAEGVERLYRAKPMTVIRAIAEGGEEKLRTFARAFRLKE